MKQPYFQVTGNIHFNQLLKIKGLTGPPPAQDAPPAQDDPITDFLEGDTLDPAQKREFIDILNFGKKEELAFTMSES